MERVYISDRTLKQAGKQMPISFREKIELSRLIDRLEVDCIEVPAIENAKVDSLLIKAVSSAVRNAEIAVPVGHTLESVLQTWSALKEAPRARLQVCAPVSSVRMEYLYHMKPAALMNLVVELIRESRKYTDRVELIAEDVSRSDPAFLIPLVQAAIDAGVSVVTFQEAAGNCLPEQLGQTLSAILRKLTNCEQVTFGVDCSDELSLASACVAEAIRQGIREIKAASFPMGCASLTHVVRILSLKGEEVGVYARTRREEMRRVTAQIESLCTARLPVRGTIQGTIQDTDNQPELSYYDSKESILRAMDQLGYILSQEDQERVYQSFRSITEKKGNISIRELDALIATEAMQVPASYQILHYAVNTGNEIGAMAHMKLKYHEKTLEGISRGDGVIDAAFMALEQAVGRHFELDDFQIQAITEGREAMGETVVRLRSQGKVYSGRGVSTDIVGASIMAYLSALNKIVYEEEEAV